MGTILYAKNMGLKEDFLSNKNIDGQVIGICRENPNAVFEQFMGKYRLHSYKSIIRPLNPYLIVEPIYGLKIDRFDVKTYSLKLEDIIPNLKKFREHKKFVEEDYIAAGKLMIENNLHYLVSDGPVYHYMKIRPVANMHVGPGESDIPKSVHVGSGKEFEEDSEPCGIDHTGGWHFENYLLYREKLETPDVNLEKKLSEILEVTKFTLNINTIERLKEFYLKS